MLLRMLLPKLWYLLVYLNPASTLDLIRLDLRSTVDLFQCFPPKSKVAFCLGRIA
jgi:hypothetical protein